MGDAWQPVLIRALWREIRYAVANELYDAQQALESILYSGFAAAIPPVGGSNVVPVGVLLPYPAVTPPTGYLVCDGSEVSQTTYADLYAVIGDTFGMAANAGDFVLPDARGRGLIGSGTGSGLTARGVGDQVGAETHQMTEDEMPAHNHAVQNILISNTFGGNFSASGSYNQSASRNTTSTGGNLPHNNMQPSLVINWIIRAEV